MGDIRIRNVDEEVILAWKERAQRHGRSMQAELHDLLSDEVFRPFHELADRLQRNRRRRQKEFGVLSDSADDIRADRGARG